jgi:hypothetical protein
MALGPTQPLEEKSARDLPGCKGWAEGQPGLEADNFNDICEPIV